MIAEPETEPEGTHKGSGRARHHGTTIKFQNALLTLDKIIDQQKPVSVRLEVCGGLLSTRSDTRRTPMRSESNNEYIKALLTSSAAVATVLFSLATASAQSSPESSATALK